MEWKGKDCGEIRGKRRLSEFGIPQAVERVFTSVSTADFAVGSACPEESAQTAVIFLHIQFSTRC